MIIQLFFQIKKMQDRVQKAKDEVSKCREKYEQALQEINKYNPIYIEDMSSVFVKCQEMEETRLRFFKKVLFSIHKTLNVTQDPTYVPFQSKSFFLLSISTFHFTILMRKSNSFAVYHKFTKSFIIRSTMLIIKRI